MYHALSKPGTGDPVVGKADTDPASKLPSQPGLPSCPAGNGSPHPLHSPFATIVFMVPVTISWTACFTLSFCLLPSPTSI